MTWWTTVPGLTPIAIHDAGNISGTQLLDRIGSNHLTASSDLVPFLFSAKSVLGNGVVMNYAESITLPTNGVIAALVRVQELIQVFEDSVTGGFMFDRELGGNWYNANVSGSYDIFGNTSESSKYLFLANLKTGTSTQMFINGVAIGSAITNKTPASINAVGSTSNAAYCFAGTEHICALGFWSGSATQSDLIALEAACRAALFIPLESNGFASAIGLARFAPSEALDALGVHKKAIGSILGQRDIYFGGTGTITGTVKEKASPDNTPLHRRVLLIEQATRTVIRETWSDAITGAYTFNNVAMQATYTVLAYDYTGLYRAVIADNILATP